MGGNSNMTSQTSYVPSGGPTAASVAMGGSAYGASNSTPVSAASVAMSNLPKPTANNPYMKNTNTQQNQFGNQAQNQNFGNTGNAGQNYGRNQNNFGGNQGQNYGGGNQGQNYGGNQNQGQNYGGGTQGQNYSATQNYGANANQKYGGNQQQNQNYGNTGQNYGGGNQNQGQTYTATQNYGANANQNYGGHNQNHGMQGGAQNMNAQANYGTSAFQNQFAQMQLQQQELVEQQRWFTHVDKDRSGSIDAAELSQLTFGGKPLHFSAAKKLLLIFDKDKNANIDFAEYITLHKFIQAMQRAFNATDSDRNGVLDSREIHHALQQAGFQLNFQACNALYHRYNKLNTGVDFVHFLEIAADIALLRVEFDLKDHDRDGVISLRFDDLLSLIANV
uniref:EF-hand domain-containing protein n=1 Tax=Vannella robusta TaxID=1487602 RepID=A0A6U1VFE7_9EUKA